MITLDKSNGGFNGITTSFYTTDLKRNEVVRRYFKALQGGYVIPDTGYGYNRILDGGYVVNDIDDDMGNNQNIYKIYSVKNPGMKPVFILFDSFGSIPRSMDDPNILEHPEDIIMFINQETYTFNQNDAITAYSEISILDGIRVAIHMSNFKYYNDYGSIPQDIVKEMFEIESVFYCDNKENLSKKKIFKKFKISERLTKASIIFQNKQKQFDPFVKPFVVIIKEKDEKIKVYLLLKDLNGTSLVEHVTTCDIGSNITIFSSGATLSSSPYLDGFSLYGGIGVVNLNEKWSIKAEFANFAPKNYLKTLPFKLFTITAPKEKFYYSDAIWEKIEDINPVIKQELIYADRIHYLSGIKRNFSQKNRDTFTHIFYYNMKNNITYAPMFSPLGWFCDNFREVMEMDKQL